MTGRAQAFTLEAILAAAVLLASVAFAVQVAGVSPLSATTSNQQVENQRWGTAAGTLDAAVANGSIKPAVLYWNESKEAFFGARYDGYYVAGGPPTDFGATLNRTIRDRGLAFNVNVAYESADGDVATRRLVHQGSPTDDAVRAAATVTLYDDDVLRDESLEPTNRTVEASTAFYAPDASPDTPVYNVLRVEVVVW